MRNTDGRNRLSNLRNRRRVSKLPPPVLVASRIFHASSRLAFSPSNSFCFTNIFTFTPSPPHPRLRLFPQSSALLTRRQTRWPTSTIFTDIDKTFHPRTLIFSPNKLQYLHLDFASKSPHAQTFYLPFIVPKYICADIHEPSPFPLPTLLYCLLSYWEDTSVPVMTINYNFMSSKLR